MSCTLIRALYLCPSHIRHCLGMRSGLGSTLVISELNSAIAFLSLKNAIALFSSEMTRVVPSPLLIPRQCHLCIACYLLGRMCVCSVCSRMLCSRNGLRSYSHELSFSQGLNWDSLRIYSTRIVRRSSCLPWRSIVVTFQ